MALASKQFLSLTFLTRQQLKVRAILDDQQKVIEFDRKNFTYADLRPAVFAKCKISNGILRFITPGGDYIDLSSDLQLQRVLKEVQDAKLKYIELKVLASGASTSYSSASTPTRATTSAPTSATASPSTPTPSAGTAYRQFNRPTQSPATATTTQSSTPTKTFSPQNAPSSSLFFNIFSQVFRTEITTRFDYSSCSR